MRASRIRAAAFPGNDGIVVDAALRIRDLNRAHVDGSLQPRDGSILVPGVTSPILSPWYERMSEGSLLERWRFSLARCGISSAGGGRLSRPCHGSTAAMVRAACDELQGRKRVTVFRSGLATTQKSRRVRRWIAHPPLPCVVGGEWSWSLSSPARGFAAGFCRVLARLHATFT